jgi:hypothetical protein
MQGQKRVSLRYALAWVYSRDEGFSDFVDASQRGSIEDGYYEYWEAKSQRIEAPIVPSLEKAWVKLNTLRASGQLSLFGTASILDKTHPRYSGEVEIKCGIVELLGDGSSNNLVQPRQPEPAIRWNNVSVELNRLLRNFPTIKPKVKPVLDSRELSKAQLMVHSAVESIWPDGVPRETKDADRNHAIRTWIAQNLKRPNNKANSVSDSTISRYFKKAE